MNNVIGYKNRPKDRYHDWLCLLNDKKHDEVFGRNHFFGEDKIDEYKILTKAKERYKIRLKEYIS